MRWALEGGSITDQNRPPAELRDWQLAKTFGWNKAQIDENPARWNDWMLAIENVAREVERDQQEKAARDARRS